MSFDLLDISDPPLSNESAVDLDDKNDDQGASDDDVESEAEEQFLEDKFPIKENETEHDLITEDMARLLDANGQCIDGKSFDLYCRSYST